MDNTPRNRPSSTRLRVDLSDGALNHPRCDVCARYIPEDRIPAEREDAQALLQNLLEYRV